MAEEILQVENMPTGSDDSVETTTEQPAVPNSAESALNLYPSFFASANYYDKNPNLMRDKFPELSDGQFNILTSKYYQDIENRPEYYQVQSGDNFTDIANQFNLYPAALKRMNPNVTNTSAIKEGQRLMIGGTSYSKEQSARYTRDKDYTNTLRTQMPSSEFMNVIGKLESRNNYQASNEFGAYGRYQIKFDEKGPAENYRKILKEGGYNVTNKDEFLNNPEAQDFLMENLMQEYAGQVTALRRDYGDNTKSYSDFDLMMAIHKVGFTRTENIFKNGNELPNEGDGFVYKDGKRIDRQVGSYVDLGRLDIKESGYSGQFYSAENRYSRPESNLPQDYYPGGNPDLIRDENYKNTAKSSAEQIVTNMGAEVSEEQEDFMQSNDYKTLQAFLFDMQDDVKAYINSVMGPLGFNPADIASGELGDVSSEALSGRFSYGEAIKDIKATIFGKLDEYAKSAPFQRLMFKMNLTPGEVDFASKMQDVTGDLDSDIYGLAEREDGEYGFRVEGEEGAAIMSSVIREQVDALVEETFWQSYTDKITDRLSSEDVFESYQKFIQDRADHVEKMYKNEDGSSKDINLAFLPDGLPIHQYPHMNTYESQEKLFPFNKYVQQQAGKMFPFMADDSPFGVKEQAIIEATRRYEWGKKRANGKSAEEMYSEILDSNLEKFGVVNPIKAKRLFDVFQEGLGVATGDDSVDSDISAKFELLSTYADELGAFSLDYEIDKNGDYQISIKQDEENQKAFNALRQMAYEDVTSVYPMAAIDNSIEYFLKASINKSTLGLAYKALTDMDVFSTFGYDPSKGETFWSDVGSFIFDPLFLIGGGIGSLTYKGVTFGAAKLTYRGAAKMQSAGFKANQINRAIKINQHRIQNTAAGKYFKRTVPGATAFGTFDYGRSILNQEINYGYFDHAQALKDGFKGSILGFTVGNVGYGFNRLYQHMGARNIPKFYEAFVKPVEFATEVGAFTIGSSVLHGGGFKDITGQDFVDTGAFLLAMKGTHMVHKITDAPKNIKNIRKNLKELTFPRQETLNRFGDVGEFTLGQRRQIEQAIGLKRPEGSKLSENEYLFNEIAKDGNKLLDILENKNVDLYTKQKLWSTFLNSVPVITNQQTGDVDYDLHQTVLPDRVELRRAAGNEFNVITRNSRGEIVEKEVFKNQEEAREYQNDVQNTINQSRVVENIALLKQYDIGEYNKLLRDNKMTEKELLSYTDIGVNNLSPEIAGKLEGMAIAAKGLNKSLYKSRTESAEPAMTMDKPTEMREGDPALYGKLLRMQKEGTEMTAEQKAEFERIDALKNEQLSKVYEEITGQPKVEVKTPEVKTEAEAPKPEAPEVKTEETPETKTEEVTEKIDPTKTEQGIVIYHGSDVKIPASKAKSGIHGGDKEQAQARPDKKGISKEDVVMNEYNYKKTEGGKEIVVERDFLWEGNEALEKRFKEDPKAYLREKEQNKELGIESDWFGDYLLDNKIVTIKELQKDPSPAGINKLLLEKKIDAVFYRNQAEGEGYSVMVVNNKALSERKPTAVETKQPKLSTQKQTFTQELDKAKSEKPEDYWSVDKVEAKDLKGGKLIEVDGGYGVVTKEGDIKGVFKKSDSKEKGVGDKVIQKAVEEGGRMLDNYDGYLTKIYEKNGFRVVSRTPFNEAFAPEGYNKEKHGTPDIVTMIYDPLKKLDIKEKTFKGENGYDKAIEYRNSFMEQVNNNYKPLSEKQKTRKKFNQRIKEIRSQYESKIQGLNEASRGRAQAIKQVREDVTNLIKESDFRAPITKSLLTQAANIKNENGIKRFEESIQRANHREDVRIVNEDISSLKRAIEKKVGQGEFGDVKTKALVNDLLNINFKELEMSFGTPEGKSNLKLLNDVKTVMEQLGRPRVGVLAEKSSPEAITKLTQKANSLIEQYKAKKEAEKITNETDAVQTVEQIEAFVNDKIIKAEGFEFESGNLVGSENRKFSTASLQVRRAQQRLNEALELNTITPERYEELSQKLENVGNQLLSKKSEYTQSIYQEGVSYMKDVLANPKEYNYNSAQVELLRKVTEGEYINEIGYAEDILITGLDAANGYFPTRRLGEIVKQSEGSRHGNPLYAQLSGGLSLKPKGVLGSKSLFATKTYDNTVNTDKILRDLEFQPLEFFTGFANAEKTGKTAQERVISPLLRAATQARREIDIAVQEWNRLTTSTPGILKYITPRSQTVKRTLMNEKMEMMGMLMLEKQYELNGGKGSFTRKSLEKYSNDYATGDVPRLQKIYDKLPKKNVEGKEVIDWQKAYEQMSSKDKKIFDYARNLFENDLKNKQQFANEYNGREFQDFEAYFPLLRYSRPGVKEAKTESMSFMDMIAPSVIGDRGQVSMKAQVGKERTTMEPSAVEFNLERILMRSINQTNRDFYMSPAVSNTFQIISNAKQEYNRQLLKNPENQNNKNVGKYLDALHERLRQGVSNQFNIGGYTANQLGVNVTQKLTSYAYQSTLARPGRLAVETGVEYLRVGVGASTPETPNVIVNQFRERLERVIGVRYEEGKIKYGKEDMTMNDLMTFTNSQFALKFNKHTVGAEFNAIEGLYRDGAMKLLNNQLISLPDRATVYLAWMPTFQSKFKELSGGVDFNRREYKNNPEYRNQYRDIIMDAASVADMTSVKWKNSTLKLGQRSQIRLPMGMRVDVNQRGGAALLTYMSNFGALESLNFGRSAQNVYFGNTPAERANGIKQMAAQFSGGVAYGIGTGMEFLLYQKIIAEQIPSDTEREKTLSDIKAKYDEMFSTEGILKSMAGNASFLVGSKYSQAGRFLILSAAGFTQSLTPGTETGKDIDDIIGEFTEIAYFTEPLDFKKYGPMTETINYVAPAYYNAIQLCMDNIDNITAYYEAVEGGTPLADPEAAEQARLFEMVKDFTKLILMSQGSAIPFTKDADYLGRHGVYPGLGLRLKPKSVTKGTIPTDKEFKD